MLSCIQLSTIVDVAYMKQHLDGTAKNGGFAFKGDFYLCLRSPNWIIHDANHDDMVSLVASLATVPGLALHRAECLRYHGDELIV